MKNLLDSVYDYIVENKKCSSKFDSLYQNDKLDAEEFIEDQILKFTKSNRKVVFNIKFEDLTEDDISKFTDEIYYRTRM